MATYEITVRRGSKSEGTLSYRGTIVHDARCWWNPQKRIPAGRYEGCSATRMAKARDSTRTQNRHAIFLPNVKDYAGIFIHYGTNLTNADSLAKWSQGCIVLAESDVIRIWNDISPHDGGNVTVHIVDEEGRK